MSETALDSTIASRSSFDPPPPRGQGRAFTLALLAHLLLVLALAWGLRWKKDAQDLAVEAELWSAVAQTAAPQAAPVQPPPPPPVAPPPPRPVPTPEPKPAPPQVNDDSVRQAELALEQQKKREEELRQEQERKAEQARLQAQRQEEDRQRKIAAAQQAAEAAKQAAAQRAAAVKAARQQAQAEQAQTADAARRQTILRNLRAQAGTDQTGMANTPVSGQGKTPGGTAKRDAGPSAGYAARVRARVLPNITYPDLSNIHGNPNAEVQVTATPDGTITDRRLTKSSGIPSWDNAVLRAIDKTQALPRDVDGRVPSPIIIDFRPND